MAQFGVKGSFGGTAGLFPIGRFGQANLVRRRPEMKGFFDWAENMHGSIHSRSAVGDLAAEDFVTAVAAFCYLVGEKHNPPDASTLEMAFEGGDQRYLS
ncbi:MAG: hypothetical protein ACLFP8_08825 [Alphaproteobacteria bacterium]